MWPITANERKVSIVAAFPRGIFTGIHDDEKFSICTRTDRKSSANVGVAAKEILFSWVGTSVAMASVKLLISWTLSLFFWRYLKMTRRDVCVSPLKRLNLEYRSVLHYPDHLKGFCFFIFSNEVVGSWIYAWSYFFRGMIHVNTTITGLNMEKVLISVFGDRPLKIVALVGA